MPFKEKVLFAPLSGGAFLLSSTKQKGVQGIYDSTVLGFLPPKFT